MDGVLLLAHRLIWAHVKGAWPEGEIDHRNRTTSDNRLFNLREAGRSDQLANTGLRSDNKSGIRGVSWNEESGKWLATINRHGKQRRLGLFASIDDASTAYQQAASETFGEFKGKI